jgi:hypothetical protein
LIDYHALLKQATTGTPDQRRHALHMIYRQDEAAVAPLIDQFYAGVNETTGRLILHILREIGGYEARRLFHEICDLGACCLSWERMAADAVKDE